MLGVREACQEGNRLKRWQPDIEAAVTEHWARLQGGSLSVSEDSRRLKYKKCFNFYREGSFSL